MNHRNNIAAGLLALGLLLPVTAYGAEEPPYNPGPMLDTIQLSAATAAPGGSLSVGLDAYDPDGIRSVWVRFIHDETETVLSLPMKPRPGDPAVEGLWSGELELPADAPLGEYALRSVVLIDRRDGRTRYLREADMNWNARDTELLEEELSFTLTADSAGPVLLGCSVLEEVITAGEDADGNTPTARVTLTVRDDAAGFDKATLIFAEPGGKKLFAALSRRDWQYDDLYQRDIPIDDHQPGGSYRLVKAELTDRAGNKTVLGYGKDSLPLSDAFACGLRIIGDGSDRGLAPALQAVTVGECRDYGDYLEYQVAVKAADRGAKLHHITVRFQNPANGRTVSKVIRAQGQDWMLGTDVYTGWLRVNACEPAGTFLLDSVVVTDEAKNAQTYRRPGDLTGSQLALPCTASFPLSTASTNPDTTPPSLLAIQMEDRTEVGVSIPIRIRAADDRSGVDTVRARFENDEGRVITVPLYEEADGWYKGHIPGAKLDRWDQFQLKRVVITDKAGNRRAWQQQPDVRGEALPWSIAFTVDDDDDDDDGRTGVSVGAGIEIR